MALAIFFISLAAIVALFAFKVWEERRGYPLAPNLRARLDIVAAKCKRVLFLVEALLAQLPSLLTYAAVRLVAFLASSLARLMHTAAEGAHGLADLVSHKHNFERRETRSNFLKQVGEYPRANGNGSGYSAETDAYVASPQASIPAPEPWLEAPFEPEPVYEPEPPLPLPPPVPPTPTLLWESPQASKLPKPPKKAAVHRKKKRRRKQAGSDADIDVSA